MINNKRHPIQIVASRTGLTQHVIRAWERRYGAVTPTRTATNRRLYSDEDVARLQLLHRAIQGGRSVGQVARLSTVQLQELVYQDEQAAAGLLPYSGEPQSAETFLKKAFAAAESMDGTRLQAVFLEAEVSLSQARVVEALILPFVEEVGHRWRTGTWRIAHEHLSSSVVRGFLTNLRTGLRVAPHAPVVVFATPAGQRHELGALMAAVIAALEGWRVAYLGPNLPSEEVVAAARMVEARVVGLSLVYPSDDPMLPHELRKMRATLPPETVMLAGGRAAADYAPVLREVGVVHVPDLKVLRTALENVRRGRVAG